MADKKRGNPQGGQKASSKVSNKKLITIELVAFVFLAVYLIGYTADMVKKPKISTEAAAPGQIDLPVQYEGIILRDETVTFSEDEGTVIYSYAENEYVKKGSVVCAVRSDDHLDALEREIESINDNIIDRQELQDTDTVITEEVQRINAKIKTETNNTIPLFLQNDAAEVYRYKNQLQKDIDSRNGIYLTGSEGALSELLDKRAVYERKLLDGTGTYKAEQGGVLSYTTDGLENILKPETMMDVSIELFETAVGAEDVADKHVSAGSPLFKTVNSNVWYLCAFLNNEIALDWKVGSGRLVYFNNGASTDKLTMRVEAIEPKDGKTYVVLSSSKYLLDFIDERIITFSLEDDSYKGLKIPNAAVTPKTALFVPSEYIYTVRGTSGVYVKEDAGASFKNVNVLSQGKESAYVLQSFDGVKLGTVIYRFEDGQINEGSGYTIEEIKTVQGVYVANSGAAEFRQISLIMKNDFYSIIESGQGGGVKPFDRIVSDASSVNDNQILR